jgi:hypothetical protein
MNKSHQFLLQSLFLMGSFIGLTGCSDVMEFVGIAQSPTATQQDCAQTPVLVTNLTQKPEGRSYQLADGRDCTEVVNGE